MKKLVILLFIASFAMYSANAQDDASGDLKSKNGFNILPEAGDIGLGINAVPVFGYFGNIMNGTANNTIGFNFVDGTNTIYGKYYLDASTAVRARVRIAKASTINTEFIMMDQMVTDPFATVEDHHILNSTNIQLGAGYELRRGKGRLQGFYGAEALIGLTYGSVNYIYGNMFSPDFNNPYTTDFGTNLVGSGRVEEGKNGSTFGLGLRGFIGVEYFFAPKISVGGEFGWGFGYNWTGSGKQTIESWNGTGVESATYKTAGGKGWAVDTDNLGGAISLIFHF